MNSKENIKFGRFPSLQGLYDSRFEHDSCGVGFVVNIDGKKSHDIIENGIKVLENLQHRGAISGDLKTGDGAGILFQVPDAFLHQACGYLGIQLPDAGKYGVGMIFMPQSSDLRARCSEIIEKSITSEKLGVLG